MNLQTVFFSAAHSGFSLDRVPLGGGAAVCYQLLKEWQRSRPFPIQILQPDLLGEKAPRDKDLVHYSEFTYAHFCREFEKAVTRTILRHDPLSCRVLCNDISEGPDFRTLGEKGYRLFTIYHVDVVDYVVRLYLKSRVKPETLTHFYTLFRHRPLQALVPDLLRLVFQKQADSVRFSEGLIVPSQTMKEIILRCYPGTSPDKIHVIPWGIWSPNETEGEIQKQWADLQTSYPYSPETKVLLTLSRISPEKGQDRLLQALSLWEKESTFPRKGLVLFICGEAAYMQGQRFMKKLKKLAGRLRRTHVYFPGYVTGARKQAFFRMADLYVFASRHESYGLTLLEALQAGLPAIACENHGVRDILLSHFGKLIPGRSETEIIFHLQEGIRDLLSDESRLKEMGQAAKDFARRQSFEEAAKKVADLLTRV